MIKVTPSSTEYAPMMDLSYPDLKEVDIQDWWNRIVLVVNGLAFTRKDVMLSLANQDGGVHIDRELNADYKKLTRENLVGFQDQNGSSLEDIHLVMARENAFYLLHALKKYYSSIVSFS